MYGIRTTADQAKNVAPEEHGHKADSGPRVKIPAKEGLEGIGIVYSKTVVEAGGEAAIILVEGEMVDGRGLCGFVGSTREK